MTDTLADSRTSSRMFTEGVPLVVEDVTGRPAAEREAMLADPGFGRYFTDRMFVARYRAGRGLVRRPADRLRAAAAGPVDRGAALRAVDLRGPQGLRPARRQRRHVPARRPTPPASPAAPSGWPCRRCPRRRSSPPSTRSSTPTATGCRPAPDQTLYIRPYQLASEPFLGVRPAHEYLFLVIASPAGAVLPARRPAGLGLPLRGLHPGRARRHRRRQVRRQLRRQPARPGAGHRGRLRPGGLARRGGEALRRGDGRDEPVLRPRLRATTPSWSPPRSPARCCPASPATR